MASNSSIEWCDATWNPVAGCSMKSPGCANCYAQLMSARLEAMGQAKYTGITTKVNKKAIFTGKIILDEEALMVPLSWKKPRRVFVNSMSDLFWGDDEDLKFAEKNGVADPRPVPFDFIDKVWAVMALCPQHTFQILTKRPERMAEYLLSRTAIDDSGRYEHSPQWYQAITGWLDDGYGGGRFFNSENGWDTAHAAAEKLQFSRPLPNVWLGASIERQKELNERWPHITKCPSVVRFLSCEPLLGPLLLGSMTFIDWVIVGSESGPGRRPMKQEWAESIREQCQSAGNAFFMKQMEIEGKISGEISDFPESLRVRQFPALHQEATA